MRERVIAVLALSVLLSLTLYPYPITALTIIPNDLNVGPYVDRIIYKVISNQDQRILALQAGEIEMDTSFFDPVHLPTLATDGDISYFSAVRNGYGHITINCRDWPLNETVLRQAFAFAFDKTRVAAEIMDGFSQEHDSLVPIPNGWCIEEQLTPHYYTAQVEIGNALLNNSGLFPFGDDGYRTYRGQAFDIQIEYPSCSCEVSGGTAQIGVDALKALYINARTCASDFNDYISRLNNHSSYDMVYYAVNFYNNDIDWLAYEYWSEYADIPYQNPTNFRNATYDGCRRQLLNGTTYEEIYNASSWMQRILHEQVPRLVVYENIYLQAYRNDKFTGHVEDLGRYISGPWTMRKIHAFDGTLGGTVTVALAQEPDSFNIFTTNSTYSAAILDNLWPSLYSHGPDLNPWPYLAEHLITETHADNSDVPNGHTRFTIDLIQNATWSDDAPLTAQDVAFTFTYILESGAYGNWAATDLDSLSAVYALSNYRVIFEFNTESYWHFNHFAYQPIIPRDIFNNETGIGYAGWNTWNPEFDPAEPNVNCGPFILTDFEDGETYEISANYGFAYFPTRTTPPNTTTTTTTSSDESPLITLSTIIAGGSIIVILTMVIQIFRYKGTES
ncbi:MAG: ABC transporter substrate-binding protein [Candidatus Thorarchaeota archaeon]|nr:ABC transporter substrate-binding protein [Candidatus Thorarchaeota archaeon]